MSKLRFVVICREEKTVMDPDSKLLGKANPGRNCLDIQIHTKIVSAYKKVTGNSTNNELQPHVDKGRYQ
jgi:hypothetical protein